MLFVFLSLSVSLSADEAPVSILKSNQPITIDGVLDEPIWQKAVARPVCFAWGKTGQKSDSPWMLARFTWDDNYLYIGYETFDENIVALGSGEQEGPANNRREGALISHATEKVDVVEFFLSFGDERFFWEIHHNAANHFNDIWCAVVDDSAPVAKTTMARFGIYFGNREFINDDAEAKLTLAKAAKRKPREGDKDTGYVGEMRLPWAGLGGPTARESWVTIEPTMPGQQKQRHHGPWKMAGAEMRILSVCQNADRKEHYHHDSPTFPGGWFHKGASHWKRYVLTE